MNNQKCISFLLLIFVVLFSLSLAFAEDTANVGDMQQVNDIDSLKENVIQDEKLSDVSDDEIQNNLGNIDDADFSNLENGTHANADEKVAASQFDVVSSSNPTTNTVEAIQNSVDAISDGGIVDLSNFAEYDFKESTLNISSSNIVLKGNGDTIIKGYGDGNGLIFVTGSNVTIDGIKFIDTTQNNKVYGGSVNGWGVFFRSVTAGGLISNCQFTDFATSIYIRRSNDVIIKNNTFNGGYSTAIANDPNVNKEEGSRYINTVASSEITVMGNVFNGVALNAISLSSGSGSNIIDNNTFYGNAYSIYVGGASSKNSVIRNNFFVACGYFKEGTIEFKGLPVISIQKASNDIAIEDNYFGVVEDNVLIAAEQGNEANGFPSELGNINVTGNVAVKCSDDIDASGSVLLTITCRGGNPINPIAPIRILDNIVEDSINVLKVTYVDSEGNSVDVETDEWAVDNGYVIKNETSNVESITAKIIPINSKADYASGNFSFKVVDQKTNNPIANKNVVVAPKDSGGNSMYWIIKQGSSYSMSSTYTFASDENGIVTIENANFYPDIYISDYVYAPVGNYVLQITGSDNIVCNATMSITINKADININIEPYEECYGSDKQVVITVTNAKTDEVMKGIILHLYMPNTTAKDYYFMTDENGISRINVSGLAVGNYKLTVSNNDTNNISLNSVEGLIKILPQTVDELEFDYGDSGSITVDLDSVNLADIYVENHPEANINLDGKLITVSGLNAGEYTLIIKGSKNNKQKTLSVPITVNKVNPNLVIADLGSYGSDNAIDIDLLISANEKATGKIKVIVASQEYTNLIQNGESQFTISVYQQGRYTVRVEYEGDENFIEIIKTTYIDAKSTESGFYELDDLEYDYGKSGLIEVYFYGANGITARVDNYPNAKVTVSGNVVTVSGLDAGEYRLYLTTITDSDHTSVSEYITVTVNKVDSSVSLDDFSFDYGMSGSAVVTLGGASGFTASVVGYPDAAKVSGNVVTVSGLDEGSYVLSVTSVPDSNHNAVTKTVTVTVNNVDSSVSLDDFSFDYGMSGSAVVTLGGASGFTASVVGHPNAAKVSGNVVTVSGLDEGSYVLSVTSVPDSNHNAVTKTVTVTVNNVDSTVDFGSNAIVFYYGKSGSTTVTLGGASGFTASVVGHPNAAKVSGNLVTISGLATGSYVLSVTSVPDSSHKAVTRTIPITVNKANANIKVSKFNVAYKGSKTWTIKVTDSSGKPVSGVGIALKVYTGSNAKTYTPVTDSNGVVNFKASGLSVGTHKVLLSISNSNYASKEVTSSVKVVKAKSLTFSVKKESIKKGTSLTVTVKSGGKNFKTGIKLKLLIYNGKKLYKTVPLKVKKFKGKNAYGIGYATNALSKGTHTVEIVPYDDVNYQGYKKTSIVVKKKGTWTKTS